MLIDLVDELTVGDQFDINLTFEDSGEMRIPVVVKAP
jgi:copper(I)-binding protein